MPQVRLLVVLKTHTKKPPYRIPSMREVNAYPKNGYGVVSTFSGAGGSCLGFKMAGFETLYANEFIPAAADTYSLNFPDVPLDVRDIREIRPEEILEAAGKKRGEIDVLEGSPPCASFSMAGKRQVSWGQVKDYSDTKQRVDDLFFEYARILGGVRPRVFVAENVSGLLRGKAKGYFKEILRALKSCGYCVEARLLDAQWLGVPQMRQRVIFIGVREDLGIAPVFPKPLPYRYTLRDALGLRALGRVIHDTSGLWSQGDVTDEPCPSITVGVGGLNADHFKVEELDFSRFAIGKEWDNLKPGSSSDKYLNLTRSHPDRPCPTVTQEGGKVSAASVTHPSVKRKFTIPELKQICAFPEDFALSGTYRKQWERLGRSVPPLMMRAVAEVIRDEVLEKCAG